MVYLSKIVTKGGDKGKTSLGNGDRVDKYDPRIETIGDIDELNSVLGLLHAFYLKEKSELDLSPIIQSIQNDLFDLGADISVPSFQEEKLKITEQHIVRIEQLIEKENKKLSPLNSFILPGGNILGAFFHLARTVTRRAERSLTYLKAKSIINGHALVYLNRLSDLFFILSRVCNDYGKEDVLWKPGENS